MLVKTAFRPAYQQIYQRFLVFPNELRCTLLSLKMLRISILQKRQFISELPLCSPRENSLICNVLITNELLIGDKQKSKQSEPIKHFSLIEFDAVQIPNVSLQSL